MMLEFFMMLMGFNYFFLNENIFLHPKTNGNLKQMPREEHRKKLLKPISTSSILFVVKFLLIVI